MNWSLINILMLFGILQGAVLIAFILNNKESNSKAKKYLLFVVLGLIMNLQFYMLRDIGINAKYPIFESLYAPWALLASGSFYLYIVYTSPFDRKEKFFKWTLIPFLTVTIFYVFFRLSLHGIIPFSISEETTHYVYMIEEYISIAFCILMGLLSYQKINQIEKRIRTDFSNYNESKLKFHRRILLLLFIYVVVWIILYSYAVMSDTHTMTTYYLLWLFIAAVIYWMALIGFVRDEALLPIFEQEQVYREEAEQGIMINVELESQNGENEMGEAYYDKLLSLFKKEEIYTNPSLSLSSLATEVGISKSYLSKVINQYSKKSFYQFVNEYRVAYFKKLCKEDKENLFSLTGLSEKAGFKSKSTFNSFFKKTEGKTPSEYLQSIR